MLNQILRTYRLTKKINDCTILDNLCIDLFENEILSLIGPYHSGKEILPMIFSGTMKADSGKIFLNEKEIKISSRKNSQENKIFTINRMPELINELSVAENICITSGNMKGIFFNKEKIASFVCDLFTEFNIRIDPYDSIKNLSILDKHIIEIISAYAHGAKVVVADHIISFYSQEERMLLFSILQMLKDKGVSILLIDSYDPILTQKSDRVMIIKNGKNTGSYYKEEISEKLIQELIGNESCVPDTLPLKHQNTKTVFQVDQITSTLLKTPVSFCAQKGEIIGFSGSKYCEISNIMYTISGQSRLLAGKMVLYQKSLKLKNIHHALKEGIWLLPRNWASNVLFPDMTVKDNICMMYFNRISTLNFINERLRNYSVRQVMKHAKIPEKYMNAKLRDLSPEDQQKLLTAKILQSKLKILLLDEPFFYHDITKNRELGKFLSELSNKGVIVLIFTRNAQRLTDFCDHIYLINN